MTNNEKALNLVQKCLDDWPFAATRVDEIMKRLEQVKALLKEKEEVVRCKDCKNSDTDTTSYPQCWCHICNRYKNPEWFCADGRKKNGTD